MQIRPKACHNVVIFYISHDLSIGTCFLGGGGVVVAKILALYAFAKVVYTLVHRRVTIKLDLHILWGVLRGRACLT